MQSFSIEIKDEAFRKYRRPAIIEYGPDDKSVTSIQYIYRFPNGYGASVVKFSTSEGHALDLWELTVTTWGDDGDHLNYSTPITDDVIGNLNSSMVCDILGKIICLPTGEVAKAQPTTRQVGKTYVRYL